MLCPRELRAECGSDTSLRSPQHADSTILCTELSSAISIRTLMASCARFSTTSPAAVSSNSVSIRLISRSTSSTRSRLFTVSDLYLDSHDSTTGASIRFVTTTGSGLGGSSLAFFLPFFRGCMRSNRRSRPRSPSSGTGAASASRFFFSRRRIGIRSVSGNGT